MIIENENIESLLINDAALMDVRAPVEFEKGSFPNATNIPILDDLQREQIGTCYKQEGQDAAIALGYQLATKEVREQRLDRWRAHCEQHPEGYLFCFRGGMRSNLTQQWLRDEGVDYPLVKGGYKAMRRFLIDSLEVYSKTPMFLLGGLTGSAKGQVISDYQGGVDLEKVANHRGSSFGRLSNPQPSQINFENALAIKFLKKKAILQTKNLLLEDEGRAIGSLSLPFPLYEAMKKSPVLVLELDWQSRLENLIQEYAVSTLADFLKASDEENGWLAYQNYLFKALSAIEKRLGSQRYRDIQSLLVEALDQHQKTGDPFSHIKWLELLLAQYYDPMYQYQLEKKKDRIVFRGTSNEIKSFLQK